MTNILSSTNQTAASTDGAQGYLETLNAHFAVGWALYAPDGPILVRAYCGPVLVGEALADLPRPDVAAARPERPGGGFRLHFTKSLSAEEQDGLVLFADTQRLPRLHLPNISHRAFPSAVKKLEIHPNLILPNAVSHLIGRVNLDLSGDDGMYRGHDWHYLSCGASALNVILTAVQLADRPSPGAILDFGAGAGRVTRWLRAAYPEAQISSCDIRQQDMAFCETTFGAKTWVSDYKISKLNAPSRYDLIWLGSVLTHLSADDTMMLIRKIISWLNPGGVAAISFHGKRSIQIQAAPEMPDYIHDAGWKQIMLGYDAFGYGYADYEWQAGYGVSLTKLGWITAAITKIPDVRLVMMAETVWDRHHNVFAVQKLTDPGIHA
jgi:SAM-dependent methyltransferase